MTVANMTCTWEEARQSAEENANVITVADRNSDTDSIKKDQIATLTYTNNNNNKIVTRKSSRIRSANPMLRCGSPITY